MTLQHAPAVDRSAELAWIDDFGTVGPRRTADRTESVVNPVLIGLALVYLVWSYYALASSIWARSLFACYLVLRMKPDIIIPYCLSCLQLRLNLSQRGDDLLDQGLEDVFQSLTGFESYAFTIVPILFALRMLFTVLSGRVAWRDFPLGLFLLWAFGGPFVVAGAWYARDLGGGWTSGIRIYCVISTFFYGLLLPRVNQKQMDRLVGGLSLIAFVLLILSVFGGFKSQLRFVLFPLAIGWATSGVLTGRSLVYSAAVLAFASVNALTTTLMVRMNWLWSIIAGVVEWMSPPGVRGSGSRNRALILGTIVACQALFVIGVLFCQTERSEYAPGFWGRVELKLVGDRGPIWLATIKHLTEEATLLAIPGRPYMVRNFGVEALWRFGPHNLVLEVLRQLGMVAGPVSIMLLLAMVLKCGTVIVNQGGAGSRAIASAVICCIVVGGTTLGYVLGDRQGEVIFMLAGAVIANSRTRRQDAAVRGHPGSTRGERLPGSVVANAGRGRLVHGRPV